MRIDRLLWFLRFASTRSSAQKWVLDGHIRLNGQRVVKPSTDIADGDVLTLPLRSRVLVIEILALPRRRGPASEARECYRELDGSGAIAIAGARAHEDAPLREGRALP